MDLSNFSKGKKKNCLLFMRSIFHSSMYMIDYLWFRNRYFWSSNTYLWFRKKRDRERKHEKSINYIYYINRLTLRDFILKCKVRERKHEK